MFDRDTWFGRTFPGLIVPTEERIHGKGTAIWASEIEPFAIAVTKHHFGGNADDR